MDLRWVHSTRASHRRGAGSDDALKVIVSGYFASSTGHGG
jgi:hypothetical protein